MKIQQKKIVDWLILVTFAIVLIAGIPTAAGCLMVFLGHSFLGLFTLSRWVAIAIWLAYSIFSIWVGFFDPSSGEVDRPERVREVFKWVIFWPIISLLQGLVLIV